MKMQIAFLMLLLLSWSSASQAFSFTCIGKDKTTPPSNKTYNDSEGNTHDTDEWKDWKNKYSDWAIRQNWSCCEKLVPVYFDSRSDRSSGTGSQSLSTNSLILLLKL